MMPDLFSPKRKAMDELHLPSRKRTRPVAQPSITSTKPLTANKTIEPTSILSILRENCRDRLYVKPIAWTSAHLGHLDCRFEEEDAEDSDKENIPPESEDPPDPEPLEKRQTEEDIHTRHISPSAIYSMERFSGPSPRAAKRTHIASILRKFGLDPLGAKSLSFYFNQKKASRIRTEGVFSCIPPSPCLAFITFDKIELYRDASIHNPPCKVWNTPVVNIRKKKLQSIQPPDRTEDPYIMAILIALAQGQRQEQLLVNTQRQLQDTTKAEETSCQGRVQVDATEMDESYQVTVLAVSAVRADILYVYTAVISAAFLDKFDQPWSAAPRLPVVAERRCIPLDRPRKSLKRLGRMLCTGGTD